MEEEPRISNRTRFLFALVGCLVCLAAALCAESLMGRMHAGVLLRRYHAASLLFRTDPQTTQQVIQLPPPPPDDAELQRRLDEAGGHSGDVQISLAWNNNNDLDLSCLDPRGELIDGYNQTSRSGGVLDVDMNPTDETLLSPEAMVKLREREGRAAPNHRTSYSNEPVENLVWAQNAPVGHYKVFVHQFCNKERVEQTPYWIVVRVHGQTHRVSGVVGRDDFAEQLIDPKLVYEFDVKAPAVAAAPARVAPARAAPPPPPRIVTHTGYSLRRLDFALLVAGFWGVLAGLLALGLLVAQRLYLRQSLWNGEQLFIVALGGPTTGFLAAALGQLVLSLFASALAPGQFPILFVLGWIVFASLFGWGLSLFTPNLPRIASPIAGALSAFAASVLFLLLAASGGDLPGRLLAASLIGGAIGVLIALPERERGLEPEPESAPEIPRAPFETQPPFIVRGTRTRKVGGLRQGDRRLDR